MQFEIGQAEFNAVLDKVLRAVETRVTIPVLANIKITAKDSELEFETTNLENALRIRVPAKIKKEGVMLVPANKTRDIVKRLPEGQVKVKLAENRWAHIEGGSAKFKVIGMDAAHFPTWPPIGKDAVEIDGQALQAAYNMVWYAVSHEQSRYTMSAVLISEGDAVATDGHRLALYRSKAFSKIKSALLPLAGMKILVDLIEGEGDVSMSTGENNFVFSAKNWTLSMRKISGQFPNYKAVMPDKEKQTVEATFAAAEFAQCVERVGLSSDSRTSGVRFTFGKDGIELFANSPDAGEAADSLPGTCSGKLTIGFNSKYILDFVRKVEGEIKMFGKDEQSAAMFEHQNVLYVAMPLRF